jgi:hypothetical protein
MSAIEGDNEYVDTETSELDTGREEGGTGPSPRSRDARRRLEELLEEKRLRAQIQDYLVDDEPD